MQVVILAGGLATRLRPLTNAVPKSLIPVCGKPFILHQLELLHRGGLANEHGQVEVLLCVGYLGEQIQQLLGNGARYGAKISYSWEDPGHLAGTGGALVRALPLLEPEFLLLYGDSYLPTDYAAVVQAFRAQARPALMCVFRNEGRWDASNVRVEAEDTGYRVALYSKGLRPGEAQYIDYGLSALKREVIAEWDGTPLPLDLAAIYSRLVDRGQLAAYLVAQRFYEIGKPEGLRELEQALAGQVT